MLAACWSNFSFGLPKIKICCLYFRMSNGFITLAASRAGKRRIEMLQTPRVGGGVWAGAADFAASSSTGVMLPQLIPSGFGFLHHRGAGVVQSAAGQKLWVQPLWHACWQDAVLPGLRVGCLQKEKQNPCQKRSFQLSPLSTALLKSRIGLGSPFNLLHGEKKLLYFLSPPL